MKTAIVILNLGGPDSMKAIEPFLFNLFSDPDIFKIPIGQKLFAKIISSRRAPKVANQYEALGGSSPINKWTELQRKMLEEKIKQFDNSITVFTAMRYWNPITKDVAKSIEEQNFDKIVLLPLYPHYSITTTGSSFNEWKRCFKNTSPKVIHVNNYHTNKTYISALNERIDQTILKFPENVRDDIQIVFSAHGTPISLVKNGDPYSEHIKETVAKVMEARNFSHPHNLCYQSKVGPVKWLTPATDVAIEDLAKKGKKNLLIVPISFVSDHVETLFELDIEYRHVADKCKIENYIVMEGLNDSKLFIDALYEEVINVLETQAVN